jgi:hypothetical protein
MKWIKIDPKKGNCPKDGQRVLVFVAISDMEGREKDWRYVFCATFRAYDETRRAHCGLIGRWWIDGQYHPLAFEDVKYWSEIDEPKEMARMRPS